MEFHKSVRKIFQLITNTWKYLFHVIIFNYHHNVVFSSGMKNIWIIPVLASILILGTLGFQEAESTTVANVDFGDSTIDTSGVRVCGAAVDNYLAGFGITAVDDPGNSESRDFCILQFDRSLTHHAIASSLPNFFFRNFGNEVYSYSLVFDTPLDSFQFTRTSYDTSFGGIITFGWNAQAFDSNGNLLGPQVGEPTQSRFVSSPVQFSFSGPDIAKVTFFSTSKNTFAGITQVPIDDLILTIPPPPLTDADGDGFFAEVDDCDDGNAAINPGATEVFNGLDDNCVDGVDEGITSEEATATITDDVQALIDDSTLNKGQGNSLTSKLDNIIEKFEDGKNKPACNQLNAFTQHLDSLIDDGVLTSAQGQPLIDQANLVKAAFC